MTSRAPGPPRQDGLLAAEYALGLLRGTARDDFSRRLSSDPAVAAEVRAWEEHFSQFADEIAPVAPPQHVLARLESRLFATDRTRTALWNSIGFWRGLAIASLAAVVVIGAWTLRSPMDGPAGGIHVAEVAGESGMVKLVALYDEAKGELRLNRVAGAAAAGRSFELWLVVGQDAPVSLGVLPQESTSQVAVPAALRGRFAGAVLAISDEPFGGSPTGVATGPIVATGKLTAL